MSRARVELGDLLDRARVERLRRTGALVLDVDDTLLARDGMPGAGEETFRESASAALLPELLRRGFRVALITGHGWRQLETRLVAPVVEHLRESKTAATCVGRLSVYANRGATKIVWNDARHAVDEQYGARYRLRDEDLPALREVLETSAARFEADVRERGEWYRAQFPRFDFAMLPARVSEREGAVLVLRPIPSRFHAAARSGADARREVYERALDLLARAGLSDDYELAASGRSSIEITRRGVSKEAAMRDLVAGISSATGEGAERVEDALVYVGDEFYAGGNDSVVPLMFPRALCLSVAGEAEEEGRETEARVVSLARATGVRGTAATEALLAHLLRLSARV